MHPTNHFAVPSPREAIGLALFSCMGLVLSAVAEQYRRSQQKVAAYAREMTVRESDRRFRTLADAIPQLTRIANADGWIHWYSDAGAVHYGRASALRVH